METLKRHIATLSRACLYLVAVVLMASGLVGCDVHEYPEIPKEPFELRLHFETAMPTYQELEINTYSRAEQYDIRYIVNVYLAEASRKNITTSSEDSRISSRTAIMSVVYTHPATEGLDCSLPIELPAGVYNFQVWVDYVPTGSTSDRFYDTHDFSAVTLIQSDTHPGNDDSRDAFRGDVSEVNVTTDDYVDVYMERPLAKFLFISTDYEQFVIKMLDYLSRKEAEAAARGEGQPAKAPEAGAADAAAAEDGRSDDGRGDDGRGDDSRTINLEDYYVVLRYTGFMPSAFNMFTNAPGDARTGVVFTAPLTKLDNNEVAMGFDYVFVNHKEARVDLMLEVYDNEGDCMARTPVVQVPLKRSQLTVIRGEFLTSEAKGGVGIVPDFDGEYNIFIP